MTDILRNQLQAALGSAYTLDRELGGGGMSRVFVARDARLSRDIVVKVFAPDLAAGISAERFAREIQLAASLQEPHIVPVLSDGVTVDGLPYYTMPFVQGASLRERLRAGKIPTSETLNILRDIANALAYAHGRGVVHRDIKPENILLSNGTAMVTDFGIAKALQASRTASPENGIVGGLTQTGTSLGTPAYMAPEQAAGDSVDARADIYAWGVIAYEMLSGAHPFSSKTTAQQLIAAHMTEAAPALKVVDRNLSPALIVFVMRCLAKNPAQRPSSADELLAALNEKHSATRSISWARFGMIAAIVLAVVGAFWQMSRSANSAAEIDRNGPKSTAPIMLAVIPFENIGADEQAIFTDGLTDAVTSKLSGLAGLGVIDRRSALQYRLTTKAATQIGEELGVRYLVQGVVRWARDTAGKWRAQVTPTLVSTKSGLIEWTGVSAIITPDDPFTAQGKIATDVAIAMQVELAPSEQLGLIRRFTENPQAFAAYQRGRSYLDEAARTTFDGYAGNKLQRAGVEFERAVALDSMFAEAWGYWSLQAISMAMGSPNDSAAASRARRVIDRALLHAPNEPMVQLVDVRDRFEFQNDTMHLEPKVFAELSRARNDVTILRLASNTLFAGEKFDSSFVIARRAATLDPLSSDVLMTAINWAYFARNWEEALRLTNAIIALDSSDQRGWANLISLQVAQGDTLAAQRAAAVALKYLPARSALAENEMAYAGATYGKRFAALSFKEIGLTTFQDSVLSYLDTKTDVYLRLGDRKHAGAYSDSICALFANRAVSGPLTLRLLASLAFAQANTGRSGEAHSTLERLLKLAREKKADAYPFQFIINFNIAGTYAQLGDRRTAVEWLNASISHPSAGSTIAFIVQNPKLLALHGSPEFEAFLREHKR